MRKLIFLSFILWGSLSFGQTKKEESVNTTETHPELQSHSVDSKNVPVITPSPTVDETDENYVHYAGSVEVKPEYPKGMEEMFAFIRHNYVIPKEILDEKITKKIFISLIVEKDGSLSNIKVLRDAGYGTGAEAIRVLKMMPKWLPAEQNGKHVRCTYLIPITLNANR